MNIATTYIQNNNNVERRSNKEYIGGKVRFTVDEHVKKYYTDHYNNDKKRLQMTSDYVNDSYSGYHTQFKKALGLSIKPHNPTDFCITVLSTMTPLQIHRIDEKMENLNLEEVFQITKTEVNDRDNIDNHNVSCCCGKIINEIITLRNNASGIVILVGSCCVRKQNMVPETEIKKMNKKIKKLKDLIKMKKVFNQCLKCDEHTIPKANVDGSVNEEKICIGCKTFEHICDSCSDVYEDKIKDVPNPICAKCVKKDNEEKEAKRKLFKQDEEKEKQKRIERAKAEKEIITNSSKLFFGKYVGRKLSEIPEDYLLWLYNEYTCKELTQYMKRIIDFIEPLIISKMMFGKYKGKNLSEVPDEYLLWLYNENVNNEKLTPYMKKIMEYID